MYAPPFRECEFTDEHLCMECNRWFKNWKSIQQHFQNSSNHPYCKPCDRNFYDYSALQKHLKSSSRHQTSLNIRCALGCGCTFPRMSDMTAHVESGYCPKASLSKGEIYQKIRQLEHNSGRGHVVTNEHARIGNGGASDRCYSTRSSRFIAERCYYAGEYCCPYEDCYKTCRSASNLAQHMDSSKHQTQLYKCIGCRRKFVALNGLMKHWEYGCPQHEACRSGINLLADGLKRLTY